MLHADLCGGVDDPQLLGGNRRRDEDDAVDAVNGSFDGRSIVKIAGYEVHSGAFQRSKACAITDEDTCRDVGVAEQRGGFAAHLAGSRDEDHRGLLGRGELLGGLGRECRSAV